MISAAQKKAKENFKKAIAYRKKTGCSLKEAFAHTYGKKVGAIKKAAPKKAAVKKAAPKKNAGFVKTVKLGTKKEVTYTKKSEVKPKKQPVKISGTKKTVKKYTDKQLKEIASDAAYANGADLDRMTARLFDDKSLVTKYLKSIKDWEIKNKTKIRVKTKKAAPKKAAIKKAAPKKAARKKTLHYAGTMNSQDGKKMYKYSLGNLDNKLINEYKDILGKIKYYETTINMFKIAIKEYKERGLTRYNVYSLKQDIVKFNSIIKELKTHSRELKKHI